MENLKIQIKIEDNDNLKEAHDLLLKLGFSTYSEESFGVWDNCPKPIWLKTNCFDDKPNKIDWVDSGDYKPFKEITIPELRDLVVLKRNNPKDANYIRPRDGKEYFKSSQNNFYHILDGEWIMSTWENGQLEPQLKPIKKIEMKEYLVKSQDGKWRLETDLVGDPADTVIEIPEWAVAYADHKNGYGFFYDSLGKVAAFHDIVWLRKALPEELPFIDDKPSQSLNDQYAEIETVRQSAWQKQEGGSHYKNLKIQPMQYALENKLDYAQANVVKYVTRHADKNGKEDLLKAIHNIELMIDFYYGDEK